MRGYAYIAYTLCFTAALIILHRFLPHGAWRAVTALVCLGLMYFCLVELPIISNARTDKEPERKYLVVLGAAVHGSTPSLSMTHRLEGALDYLEAYPDSVAIVSGGQGQGEDISEAQAEDTLPDGLTLNDVRKVIVRSDGQQDLACYELDCSDGSGGEVKIYVNAVTGRQADIVI